jgi:hypothetical protein
MTDDRLYDLICGYETGDPPLSAAEHVELFQELVATGQLSRSRTCLRWPISWNATPASLAWTPARQSASYLGKESAIRKPAQVQFGIRGAGQ